MAHCPARYRGRVPTRQIRRICIAKPHPNPTVCLDIRERVRHLHTFARQGRDLRMGTDHLAQNGGARVVTPAHKHPRLWLPHAQKPAKDLPEPKIHPQTHRRLIKGLPQHNTFVALHEIAHPKNETHY